MDSVVDGPAISLNVFLLRTGVTPVDAWSDASGPSITFFYRAEGGLDQLRAEDLELLDAVVPGDIIVALQRKPKAPPSWLKFFRDRLGLIDLRSTGESLGAVIFCAVSDNILNNTSLRWTAWTFGSASRSLRRSAHDPRFGLLVALNLLAAPLIDSRGDGNAEAVRKRDPRLREMRYRTTAPYVQQTGHRAARDIPLDGFRVDRSSDLVASIGGTGADPALSASTILGGRSLRFRAHVANLDDFTNLSEIAVTQSRRKEYKEPFYWIDNILLVDDIATVSKLRRVLTRQLVENPDSPSLDVIFPDDLLEVGDDRSIRYIAFPGERRLGGGRITLPISIVSDFLARIDDELGRDRALDTELRFFDESGERVAVATVLECISADLRVDEDQFIAYDGDFYRVDKEFVGRIDSELLAIPCSSLEFLPYRGETEPTYNARIRKESASKFVVLDRALIRIPGERGTVEACDFVASSGALVHVKRKGKSSVLSHLFLQVANSCELLRRSAEARRQFEELLEEHGATPEIVATIKAAHQAARKNREEIEVVFAFLGDWAGKTIENLPLFSRISLVHEARRVAGLGYRPTVKTISYR